MKLLLLLLLSSFPVLGCAGDTVLPEISDSLKPADTTLALFMLYRIFGSVGDLHGTGSQIVAQMFSVFNSVILTFAGLLCTYTTFFGIANTNNEGEILGKKWSSVWIPIRTIAGSLLLAPQASGYSIIQIVIISIVVQGVGAADRLWESALHYLDRFGTIVESMDPIQTQGNENPVGNGEIQTLIGNQGSNSFLINRAGEMLKVTTCMSMLNRALQVHYKDPTIPYFTIPTPELHYNGADVVKASVKFPGKLYHSKLDLSPYEGACGTVEWKFKKPQPASTKPRYMTVAAQQMLINMWSTSGSMGNYLFPLLDNNGSPPRFSTQKIEDFLLKGRLLHAAYDFYAIMKPELRALSIKKEEKEKIMKDKNFISDAAKLGFAGAASWHSRLIKLNAALRNLEANYSLDPNHLQVTFQPAYKNKRLFPFSEAVMKVFEETLPVMEKGPIDRYIEHELTLKGVNENASKFFPKIEEGTGLNDSFLGKISYVLLPMLEKTDHFQRNMEAELAKNQDPIVALSNIGTYLIDAVITTWAAIVGGTAAIMTAITLASFAAGTFMGIGIAPAINAVLSIISLLGLFIPLFATWMAVNFTVGALLAYYVPLIPYILFFFCTLHWLAFVMEAVASGPLVAFGIMYPEGHDIMGSSGPTTLLLLSVFLRPMLMIFGFVLGIIVCTVAFELFCYTYTIAIDAIHVNSSALGLGKVVYMTSQVSFMGAFLTRMVTSSYSLIYEIPNKVLRWIGGPLENLSEAEALNRVESATSRQSEHMGQSISSKSLESGSMISPTAKAGSQLGLDRFKSNQQPNNIQDGGNQQPPPGGNQDG